jgi:hypothetical protein
MADLLADRSGSDSPIFRANMERIIKRRAGEMDAEQSKGYSAFKNSSFRGRSFITDGDSLTYTQSALYRFVDMKKLRYPGTDTQYRRKKVYAFHNRIVMGQYNGLMKELTYGAADEVKADLISKFDNVTLGK